MKKIIEKKSKNKNNFFIQCECRCSILEFERDKEDDFIYIICYTNNPRKLSKKKKLAWDIVLEKKQAEELLENLTEMLKDNEL